MARAVRRSGGAAAEAINTVDKSPKRGVNVHYVTDDQGRRIGVKIINALESMRLSRAAGKDSQNTTWMMYATVAASVVSIDGEEVPSPRSISEIEAIIQRLDNSGVMAVAEGLKEMAGVRDTETDPQEAAKNLP
jgi:hypothetical protein